MTHDELLAKMAEPSHNLNANEERNVYLLALQAAVELHKPMSHREPYCNECRGVYQGGIVDVVFYPCPTIQAIEKELG
jgi:hypothetical protein